MDRETEAGKQLKRPHEDREEPLLVPGRRHEGQAQEDRAVAIRRPRDHGHRFDVALTNLDGLARLKGDAGYELIVGHKSGHDHLIGDGGKDTLLGLGGTTGSRRAAARTTSTAATGTTSSRATPGTTV